MTEPDDIERLIDLSKQTEHAQTRDFEATFARLWQEPASPPTRFSWRGLALAGMGLSVAVAVVALVGVTLLAKDTQPTKNNQVGQNAPANTVKDAQPTNTVGQAGSTTGPTITPATASNNTISATQIAAAEANLTALDAEEAQLQSKRQTQTAQAQAGTPTPTDSMVYLPITAAGSQERLTALAVPGGLTSTVPPQPTIITRYGTITNYDSNKGVLLMTAENGTTTTVRLTGQTPVMNGTAVSTLGEVKVGAPIAVTGTLNAQGELEARQLYLNPKGAPRQVGNPGYPENNK